MDVTKRKKKKDSLFFFSSKGSFCLFNYSDSGAAIAKKPVLFFLSVSSLY